MILLSNMAAQELQPGQALTFNDVKLKSGCCECFNRQLPTSVKLKAQGIYDISFSGNITGSTTASPVQIAVAINGQPLVETAMNSVPTAAGDLHNVSTKTAFRNCCCDLDRLSIINTGVNPVTIAPNSAFLIQRHS